MTMTKKDFEELAEIISNAKRHAEVRKLNGFDAINCIEIDIAQFCSIQNPRFDSTKFKEACALQE